jgi:predicted Zn-dependent peptidase
MGWSILGEEATVAGFSRDMLQGYMASNYRAGGMTLVASGAVRHDEIVRLAEKAFAGLTPGRPAAPQAALYGGGDARFAEDLEQAHIAFAFPGLSNADPDYYVGQLYTAALGGGTSSRLFQEVREKRGLCYSIYAFTSGFQDGGYLSVYAGTGEAEAAEIAAVVAGEMEAIAGDFGEAELARSRAQLRASLLMGLERPAGRAEQIAGQLFSLGRIQSPAEIIAQLDAIDLGMVRRYAARVLETGSPAIAAIGPIARLESHERFARRFGAGAHRHAAE